MRRLLCARACSLQRCPACARAPVPRRTWRAAAAAPPRAWSAARWARRCRRTPPAQRGAEATTRRPRRRRRARRGACGCCPPQRRRRRRPTRSATPAQSTPRPQEACHHKTLAQLAGRPLLPPSPHRPQLTICVCSSACFCSRRVTLLASSMLETVQRHSRDTSSDTGPLARLHHPPPPTPATRTPRSGRSGRPRTGGSHTQEGTTGAASRKGAAHLLA